WTLCWKPESSRTLTQASCRKNTRSCSRWIWTAGRISVDRDRGRTHSRTRRSTERSSPRPRSVCVCVCVCVC
ncbi:protocadherin Fat 1 isoform X1, partial [Clarias magur]